MSERDLFIAALQISDPAQRSVWLDRECGGDAALRQRIEVLLQALDKAGSLLDNPVVVPPANVGETGPGVSASNAGAEPSAEQPGTVVGPYKLLEQIGEGGMGTVWMAQQTEPVKRLVALKLIKAGMDSRQVIARFEAERQALALMDHAHIARVLDAGTTSAGRPYFVMDLVKGVPITRYCDEHRLTPRQRLELFIPVCQAVQHAHQKGIIHRDLKPSNVLVALYDGKPVPKVIDFGVAKATGQQLTEKTLVTGFGALVGTLEYMSPEQAEINQLNIDTRSDICSLGVLLYELLAGSPPFTRKELEKAGVLEMLRVIREQEPSKPSTKLSTAEGLPTLAANRGTELAKLTKLIRGELDWIVMKALEKDRSRRYETANGFAQDVQRYLADEPVQAGPPSTWYRFRRFARRNRVALAVAGMVLAFIVLLGGGVGWALRDRAARQEETAQQAGESLARARKWIGENKLTLARQELAEAKGRIGGERTALRGLTEQIEALEAELDRFETFLSLLDQARQAELPGPVEMALLEHGTKSTTQPSQSAERDPAKAVPFLLQALSLYQIMERDDWPTMLEGGLLEPSQVMQVRRSAYEELLWLADDVGRRLEDHRTGKKVSAGQAASDMLAYLRKAEAGFRPTSAFYQIRARCRKALEEAEPARTDQALAAKTPAAIALDHFLPGLTAYAARNKVEGVKQFEAALRVEPTHYWSLMRLGYCLTDLGDQEQDFAAAVAAFSGCILKRPDHAHAYFCRGNAYMKLSRHEEALADFAKAIELDPKHAQAWDHKGVAHLKLGQSAKALADCSKAIELDPKSRTAWNNRGIAYGELGEEHKALADHSKAIEVDPKQALAWANRGISYSKLGQPDKALADCSKAIELDPKLVAAWSQRGTAYERLGQLDKAIPDFTKAIELDPKHTHAWRNRGVVHRKLGQPARAVEDCSKAIELDPKHVLAWRDRGLSFIALNEPTKALADFSTAIDLDPTHAPTWNDRGVALKRLGQWDQALANFDNAIKLDPNLARAWTNRGDAQGSLGKLKEALADHSKAIELDSKLALAWCNRGRAYLVLRESDKALADFSKAIELDPKFADAWSLRGVALSDLGRQAEALADLEKALELDPQHALAWAGRGQARLRLGDPGKALADLSRAVELDPTISLAWFYLGQIYAGSAQWDKAIANYSKAIDLEPTYVRAWSSRGWAHMQLNQLDKAVADHTRAIELSPKGAGYWNNRGVAFMRLRQWDKALADFAKAMELDPKDAMACINAAEVYQNLNQWDQALVHYSKALELNPKDAWVWSMRGWTHMQLGQLDKALTDHARAIELSPGTGLYWTNRSVAYLRLKQPDKALADCAEAIKLDPKWAPPWFNRGEAYRQLGEWEKAADAYLTSLRLKTLPKPDVPLAQENLAQVLKELEKHHPKNENLRRFQAEAAELRGIEMKKD